MSKPKVILIHGNGGETVDGLWFPYLRSELASHNVEVVARNFPDAQLACDYHEFTDQGHFGGDYDKQTQPKDRKLVSNWGQTPIGH